MGLALALRGLGILLVGDYHAPWLSEYEVIARSLLGEGFFGFNFEGLPPVPSSFMPPLYPVLLVGIMAVTPEDSDLAAKLVQSLLSAVSVLVTFYLAREVFRRQGVALVAAFSAAVYPSFIAGALEISTVTLEVLLVQLFALFIFRWHRAGDSRQAVGAGLALGCLALTRAPALLLAPLFSLWMLWLGSDQIQGKKGLGPALFLAGAALVIAPWTARNFAVHGALVPISTNGGLNLWVGNNPAATGEFAYFGQVDPALLARASPLGEVERDSLFYTEALSFIRENPGSFLLLLAKKAFYFWWFRPSTGSSYPGAGQALQVARTAMAVAYGAVLPLAAIGLFLSRRQGAVVSWIGFIALPYLATSTVYFAATRFRSPVEPFLIILAAYTVARTGDWLGARRASRGQAPIVRAARDQR